MKNKLTRKLMLSAFTLLFAVISLGASTYAWFVLSEEADVEAFSGTVVAASGIEMSITDYNDNSTPSKWFVGLMKNDDIQAYVNKDFTVFEDLTSQNGKEFYELNNDVAVDKATSTSFIAFNLWFRAPQTCDVNLSALKFTTTEDSAKVLDQGFTLSTGKTVNVQDEILFKVEDAARVSFVDKDGNLIKIYQKPTANDQITDTEGKKTGYSGNSIVFANGNGAHQYYQKKTNTTIEVPDAPKTDTYDNIGTGQKLITLKANTPTYITVYVWIEGYDGECINYIFKQILAVDFAFALKQNSTQGSEPGNE